MVIYHGIESVKNHQLNKWKKWVPWLTSWWWVFNPFEKCASPIGSFPQVGVNLKIFETTTQLIDGNIFTSKKTRPWHAPWKVRPISHGSVLMAKDSSFPKAASTHPRPDNILDVTLWQGISGTSSKPSFGAKHHVIFLGGEMFNHQNQQKRAGHTLDLLYPFRPTIPVTPWRVCVISALQPGLSIMASIYAKQVPMEWLKHIC